MYNYTKLSIPTLDLSHADDSKTNVFYVAIDDSDSYFVRQWHTKTKPPQSIYPVFKVTFADMYCGTHEQWDQSKSNMVIDALTELGVYRDDADGYHLDHEKIKRLQPQGVTT
jgi:hypothetical protein